MRTLFQKVFAPPLWTKCLVALNLICLGTLLLADYPTTPAAIKLIGSHATVSENQPASETSEEPATTAEQHDGPPVKLRKRHWEDLWNVGLAFFLLLVPPIATALLAFDVWRGGSGHYDSSTRHAVFVNRALLGLCLVSALAYLVYFSETYHVGVLCLALMAWFIAFSHLADLEKGHHNLLTRLYLHSIEMQKRMEYSFTNNLKAFYEDFLDRVKGADRRVFSVERVWTMTNKWSAKFEARKDGDHFKTILEALQAEPLFHALTKTKAKDIIFIGPSPRRSDSAGYVDKELEQFYAMIYTTCLLELARTKRLEVQPETFKSHEPGAQEDKSGAYKERVRIRCAVGDVPCWVKIVDDGFFDMFGTPPLHFGFEPHFYKDDDRVLSRVSQYERLILEYENYSQRVYTFVSAELLYWLNNRARTSKVREDDLKMFLFGSKLDGSEIRGKLTVHLGVELLKFFFALHYRKHLKLEKLDIPFRDLTYHQLWERCS